MDTINLEVQKRDKTLKVKDLLKENLIPLEYYGKGVENQSYQVDYQTFRRVFKEAAGNTIISLKAEGSKDEMNVLVHQVDYNPITDNIVHVDFINVRMGEVITTRVPLTFVGVAPAVKELAGTFVSYLNEIEVKCLPKDLIHGIEVNIELLTDFHINLRVSDLTVPDTIEILNGLDDVVAAVTAPRDEEEVVAEEGVEGAEGEGAEGEEGSEGEEGDKKEEGKE